MYLCTTVRTVVAISLSLLIFFQNVGLEISDIFMLKDLTEHVKYHSEEYGDSVFAFFQKHYGSLQNEHRQNDDPNHEKLPFQHNNCHHVIVEVVLVAYEFELKKPVVHVMVNPHFFYQNLYTFLENNPIFQPPQIA